MHHPANHLRGRGGHRHRLAGSSRAILGIVVQPLGCAELPFPWCSADRARSTFFSTTFSARRPPVSPLPFFLTTPSRPSRQNGGRKRALTRCRVAAPPREALPAAVHFLVGWLESGGSARAGEGRRVSLRRALRGSAGGRAGARRGPGSRCSAASFPRRRPPRTVTMLRGW